MTRGIFLWGDAVSPAVIAIDSVPPYAKDAVTKTEAKPPMPPTKGASPIVQYLPPIYSPAVLPPALTAMPRKMKMIIVTTFRSESQYSICYVLNSSLM